jgi:competence protein ComEA
VVERDRPSFRRRTATPQIASRVRVLVFLLVSVTALLAAREWWFSRLGIEEAEPIVVEVRGDVPNPGFHPVVSPVTVHRSLAAAGQPVDGFVDATLESGTRLVVSGDTVRMEAMDDLLVFGLPIDVNTASEVALQTIPGVGPSRARAIVADREADGPFSSIDDLQRVRGIGPATVDDLRPFVAAGTASWANE